MTNYMIIQGQGDYIKSLKTFSLGQVGRQSNSNASIICSKNRNAMYLAYMYICQKLTLRFCAKQLCVELHRIK